MSVLVLLDAFVVLAFVGWRSSKLQDPRLERDAVTVFVDVRLPPESVRNLARASAAFGQSIESAKRSIEAHGRAMRQHAQYEQARRGASARRRVEVEE